MYVSAARESGKHLNLTGPGGYIASAVLDTENTDNNVQTAYVAIRTPGIS